MNKSNPLSAFFNPRLVTIRVLSLTGGLIVLAGAPATSSQTQTCVSETTTFDFTGATQTYTVPQGVTAVTIIADGAQGGNNGGLGAEITGTIAVTPGEVLTILVGGAGAAGTADSNTGGGGGGGSFVVRSGNVPLVVAGGGGGFSSDFYSSGTFDPAISGGQAGNDGGSTHGSGGGTGGNGASPGTQDCCAPGSVGASGGSGFSTDGGLGAAGNGGFAYVNGGGGGTPGSWNGATFSGGSGGFGGGAGIATDNAMRCGGGGGYSGGQGGSFVDQGSGFEYAHGGGGGSFNAGSDQTNTAGAHSGNGVITITPKTCEPTTQNEVQGSGTIAVDDGHASLRINVKMQGGAATGVISYDDPHSPFTTNNIKSLVIHGNHARITGVIERKHRRIVFKIGVTDNGSPGTLDTFSIHASNGYSASGNLTSGSLTID